MYKTRKRRSGKYAKRIAGYGGEKFALFDGKGKRVGQSSMVDSTGGRRHIKELRSRGYVVRKGYVMD